MTDRPIPTRPAAPQTREERLAVKLRENLRRRKAQARALGADGPAAEPPGDSGPTLSKPGSSR